VQRARILFPLSQIGAVTDSQREQIIKQSRIYGKYDKAIDRESAFEVLLVQAEKDKKSKAKAEAEKQLQKESNKIQSTVQNTALREVTRQIVRIGFRNIWKIFK